MRKMASGKRLISDLRLFGRGYLRNVAGLFFGLIFPVILIVIFGAIFSANNTGDVTVYLQNQDTSVPAAFVDISGNFTEALNSTILNEIPCRPFLIRWNNYSSKLLPQLRNATTHKRNGLWQSYAKHKWNYYGSS